MFTSSRRFGRLLTSAAPIAFALAPLVALQAPLLAPAEAVAAPKTTAITLQTLPAAAEVTLLEPGPEKLLGVTPLTKVKVPQGAIKLRFRLSGYEDKIETLTIGKAAATFNFQLVRKIMPATLDLAAGDPASNGATVVVDGEEKGNLPLKVQVPPGRHQIVVKKDGYLPWEKWADVTENQVVSYEIALKAAEKPKGSLFVSSAPVGAEVKLNGAPKGKAPIALEGLEPGTYEVELVLDGHKPWKQQIAVKEGGKETLAGTLEPTAAATGELKVLCDAPSAEIWFDGENKGAAPATITDVKPGDHIIECRAPNYPPASKTVTIAAGSLKTEQLSPKQAVAAQRGSISVVAPVPGAKARIGDGPWKKTPALFEDLNPGKYLVVVEADGHAPWSSTETVEAQRVTEVKAELKAMGKVLVKAPAGKKADVYIDGGIVGSTPVTLDLPVGPHKIRVVSKGAADEEYDVAVNAGQTSTVTAKLLPPPEPKVVRHSNPTSAHVQDPGKGTVQLGVGLPSIVEATIGAGIMNRLEGGVQIRNVFHIITEFELQAQYQLLGSRAFALGVEAGIGGGLGAEDRSSFTVQAKPMASLLLGEGSSFTLYTQLRFFADTLSKDFAKKHPKANDTGIVWPVGLQGEFQIKPAVNFWLKAEMELANKEGRALYDELTDVLNSRFRGGVGITWLFN